MSPKTSNNGFVFPLWLYPTDAPTDLLDTGGRVKRANLSPEFVTAMAERVGSAPSPEDTFAWIYAVLHAPSYRSRYGEFLKRDFPRIPLPPGRDLFNALVAIGNELIALHTMDTTLPRITRFDVTGSNVVDKVHWAEADPARPYTDDTVGDQQGRVYINAVQYFSDVPQGVWDMHVGGYRVAEKWLKDRKGRVLSYDDMEHYQSVIAALARTLTLQTQIDTAIGAADGWPLR